LTDLDASQIIGKLSDALLSSNVALLNASQTFSAAKGLSAQTTLEFGAGVAGKEVNAGKIGYQVFSTDALDIVGAGTNTSSRKITFWAERGATFAGPVSAPSFTGAGSNLTSLNASLLTSGTVPDARLSTNVALLSGVALRTGGNAFSGNQTITNGTVGIGTASVPRNGVGAAMLAVNGTASSLSGPHVQYTVASDDYPVFQQLNWSHDNISQTFDAYYDGAWRSSSSNGSFQIYKLGSQLTFSTATTPAGIVLSWAPALTLTASGNVGIGNVNPTNKLMVVNARCDGTTWINASDRNLKQDFEPVDPLELLAKVTSMPVQSWSYKSHPQEKHVGPVAQDFHAAFGLGSDDKSIATVDESGVALAAIQGLNQKLEEARAENAELKARLDKLEKLLDSRLNGGER
jgi:hypothetical protein